MTRPDPTAPSKIGAVVPACNEQLLLAACLAGLDRAAASVQVPVTVALVLDACTDRSREVARAVRLQSTRLLVLDSDRQNVGYARDLGARTLIDELGADGLWLASSDADSVVPPDWFRRQLAHQANGAQAVLGTVEVADWSQHRRRTRRHYLRGYRSQDGHRHTHGANLSLSAEAYLGCGGFPHLTADEDVELVQRLVAGRHPIAWAGDLAVTTSARPVGRAPSGFAGHLRAIAAGIQLPVPGRVADPAPERSTEVAL